MASKYYKKKLCHQNSHLDLARALLRRRLEGPLGVDDVVDEGRDLPRQRQLDLDPGVLLAEVDLVDGVALPQAARQKAGEAAAHRRLDLLLRDPLLVGVEEVAVLDAAVADSGVPTFNSEPSEHYRG